MSTKRRSSGGKKTGSKNEERRSPSRNRDNKNDDAIFPDGIVVFNPHKNAPRFVIGTVVINPYKLNKWCEDNPDCLTDDKKYGEQLKLSIKESKGGKLYASVDTYGTDAGEKKR